VKCIIGMEHLVVKCIVGMGTGSDMHFWPGALGGAEMHCWPGM